MVEESGYVAVRTQVRWGDCDPAGIAFYPRFFEWMDMGSHALERELGLTREDVLPPRALNFPLVAARAEFLAPARMEDIIEIRVWVTRIGRTSLSIRHEIVRLGEDETVLARGSEDRVHIERDETGAMCPRELTPEMRAVLDRFADPGARRAAHS